MKNKTQNPAKLWCLVSFVQNASMSDNLECLELRNCGDVSIWTPIKHQWIQIPHYIFYYKFHENWYCAMLQREGITCLFASDPSNRTLEYFNFNQKSFSNFSCMFLNPNIFFQFEF